ncbi:hypothetical protein [Pyxidicoccus sp. MSG2]|uniref:hypothetical protein n=1 Tax=Pyxidicoccus sp. MSG2 TaxID=2996790 RepID=UPI00226E22F3|nr:hypothetical protein [Pyxidicoccus sp. MSG2]MCY1018671.1 hypothetical protein [Pyxidicoccus sp. MSG2]
MMQTFARDSEQVMRVCNVSHVACSNTDAYRGFLSMRIKLKRSYRYEEICASCQHGEYPFSRICAASGRANYLLGVSQVGLAELEQVARAYETGLVLIGSRVSGPRVRQRTLHPVLEAALPLLERRRAPSAVFRGAEGLEIDKTVIKDFGTDDPRSSDLSVVLVQAHFSEERFCQVATELEERFAAMDWGFPVHFFGGLRGEYFRNEAHFQRQGVAYLRSQLPPQVCFPEQEICIALKELYFAINLSGTRSGDLS